MSRSTKLATAAYILTYVACKAPTQVTTDTIAEAVDDHPARVRQIVAALVKGGVLKSVRGANGGVVLTRPPEEINLRHVFEVVEDQPIISLALKDGYKGWGTKCRVRPVVEQLYKEIESDSRKRMAGLSIAAMIGR